MKDTLGFATTECPDCHRTVKARTDGTPRMHWKPAAQRTNGQNPWCEGGYPEGART